MRNALNDQELADAIKSSTNDLLEVDEKGEKVRRKKELVKQTGAFDRSVYAVSIKQAGQGSKENSGMVNENTAYALNEEYIGLNMIKSQEWNLAGKGLGCQESVVLTHSQKLFYLFSNRKDSRSMKLHNSNQI